MMFVHPVDGELQLQLLRDEDAEELYTLVDVNREHLREWLPWVDGTRSSADTLSFVHMASKQYAANNGVQCGIRLNGRIVGCIGFHSVDWANQKTSIGYWLAKAYEGRGVMTRSCRTMVDMALREWGLNRVEIRAAVGNRKSRAVAERLGFIQEGIIRQAEWLNKRYVDHVVYGMLAAEWRPGKEKRDSHGQ